MIEGVTAVSVLWQEAHRARRLLSCLTNHFPRVVVVVQDGDDDTYEIAEDVLRARDVLIRDEWRGGGDFSMPLALSHVETEYVFVISGDEYPSMDLLSSMPRCVADLDRMRKSGAFIMFDETIEGLPYVEHGKHVRLFRASGGWEPRHHSAASHVNTLTWIVGRIHHDRSLDEVVRDYLRKYRMMTDEGLTDLLDVQRTMLRRSTKQTAAVKGWDWVKGHDWWPDVCAIAYDG